MPAVSELPLYVIAEVLQNARNSVAFANAFTFLAGALPLFTALLLFTLDEAIFAAALWIMFRTVSRSKQ